MLGKAKPVGIGGFSEPWQTGEDQAEIGKGLVAALPEN